MRVVGRSSNQVRFSNRRCFDFGWNLCVLSLKYGLSSSLVMTSPKVKVPRLCEMFPIASRHPSEDDQARFSQSRRYDRAASRRSEGLRAQAGFASTPAKPSSILYWSSDDVLITSSKDLLTFQNSGWRVSVQITVIKNVNYKSA